MPISQEIDQTEDVARLSQLAEEVKDLFLKTLSVNKRGIRKELDKKILAAKLNLYSDLYRKIEPKYNKAAKGSVLYKPIPKLDKLIRDYQKAKTITYSEPEDDSVDSLSTPIEPLQIEEIEPLIIESDMENTSVKKQPFFRNDKQVIEDAIRTSLDSFLFKYRNTTTSEESLTEAYYDIRSSAGKRKDKEVIVTRVGQEGDEQPLETLSATTGQVVRTDIETPIPDSEGKTLKERVAIAVEQVPVPIPAPTIPTNACGEEILFKKKPKAEKESIVKSYMDKGLTKVKEIIEEMKKDGYLINHYDDVYNVWTKLK